MGDADVAEILNLPTEERLHLVEHPGAPANREPLAALRALSGSAHSDFANILTDKYAHVGIGRPR